MLERQQHTLFSRSDRHRERSFWTEATTLKQISANAKWSRTHQPTLVRGGRMLPGGGGRMQFPLNWTNLTKLIKTRFIRVNAQRLQFQDPILRTSPAPRIPAVQRSVSGEWEICSSDMDLNNNFAVFPLESGLVSQTDMRQIGRE